MKNKEIHIAVANNKGGAAKTMTVIHLAQAFSEEGKKVIVIDGDKNETCRNWAFRRKQKGSFQVLSIREAMKYGEEKDIVIYDTEGGIASSEIKELSKMCDFIVIPCKPDYVNIEATEKMVEFFRDNSVKYRVLLSDAMPQGSFMRANDSLSYFKARGVKVFEQIIPRSAKIVDAGDTGRTVGEFSGSRFITDRFSEVAQQVLSDVDQTEPEKKLIIQKSSK